MAEKEDREMMNDQKRRKTPGQAVPSRDAESRCDRPALSEEALGQVSAAGETAVPTVYPDGLLGLHARPDDPEKNKP